MAIQFKEIQNRTEELMEQGRQAENEISTCQNRVSQAQASVNQAMSDLQRANEPDKNGKPKGDVDGARNRLEMARNQLDASKRALVEAKRNLEGINESKKSLADEIQAHNDVERSNLEKIKALKRYAFAENSNALADGIAERINEAEDARARLLESLGLDANVDHVNGGGEGGTGSQWSMGEIDAYDAGGREIGGSSDPEGTGGSIPLSMSAGMFVPKPSDLNSDPAGDIKASFTEISANYEKSSPEWQENANRMVESMNSQIAGLDSRIEASRQKEAAAMTQMRDYLNNDLHSVNDPAYDALQHDYVTARNETGELQRQRRNLAAVRDSIAVDIDPSQRTTFRGFGGSDFDNAYNGIITSRQGNSVPGFRGTCGINEECSLVNQQNGTDYGEKYGIEYSVRNKLCYVGDSPGSNGGTNFVTRKRFLNAHGLSFERIEGARDTRKPISLDDVAARFNAGYSAGLMLKGTDLCQPGLDTNARKRRYGIGRSVATHNLRRFKANHATTIAGFSYYSSGKVAGVWINDTGNMTGHNRIYISREKFDEMQAETNGFAVEFSRRISRGI